MIQEHNDHDLLTTNIHARFEDRIFFLLKNLHSNKKNYFN